MAGELPLPESPGSGGSMKTRLFVAEDEARNPGGSVAMEYRLLAAEGRCAGSRTYFRAGLPPASQARERTS
jgi:hypothetical protein